MGYPGSLAAPYVQWLLTDRVISPPETQVHPPHTPTNTTEMQVYPSLTLPTLPMLLTHVSSYSYIRVRILQTQSHYTEKLLFHARGYYVNDYARLFPGYPPPPPLVTTERHEKKSGGKNRKKTDKNKHPAGASEDAGLVYTFFFIFVSCAPAGVSSAREDTGEDAGFVYTSFFVFLIGKKI
jgi:hypothetical protein